jgi:hypothetical protein
MAAPAAPRRQGLGSNQYQVKAPGAGSRPDWVTDDTVVALNVATRAGVAALKAEAADAAVLAAV